MARPKVTLELEPLTKLAEMGCTQEEVAAFFNCSRSTVAYRLSREPFKSAWEKGQARCRISLRRAQMQAALDGDRTLLIWMGKQFLGQVDKVEQKVEQQNSFVVEIPAPMSQEEWLKTFGGGSAPTIDGPLVNGTAPSLPAPKRQSRTAKA